MRRTGTKRYVRHRGALAVFFLIAFVAVACAKGPSIRVQNLGSGPAQVNVTYYDSTGRAVTSDAGAIAPGHAGSFAIGSNKNVPDGYRGSALIDSDQPIIALRRTDMKGRSAEMIDGELLAPQTEGGALFLPLVMSHGGAFQSWESRLFIHNMSDTTACVTLTYISAETGGEVKYDPKRLTSRTRGSGRCPNGGTPLEAHATLLRDPASFGVPSGFAGAVRVDTSANSEGVAAWDQFLAASVDTYNTPFNLLASYRGLTRGELSTRVVLPLVERQIGPDGSYGTRFQIVSGDSKPVRVSLHIEGIDGAGNPVSKDSTFTFTGAKQCEQSADDAANCLAPGDALPPGFSGTARVVASSAVGIVVQRGSYFGGYASYRAMPEEEGSRRVALPAANNTSWIRIRVVDGGVANVRIRYTGGNLPGGQQMQTVTVRGTATVFQADAGLPAGFDGAAIVESDRPIVALGAFDFGAGGDRGLIYDAFPF